MKLRIRDNTLRLRLTQGEVAQLRDEGRVAAKTVFPGGREFGYVIESSPARVRPGADFENGTVRVRLPEAAVRDWADSDMVTIRDELALDEGGGLVLLVEKDFACLAPRPGEDESDMFPHPEAGRGHGPGDAC
ncbi:MAG: hypothetical protein R3176_08765 [Woeseiaceae bacterium]|nr:hypothetical protein [Woeseiaceae bacterium]